MNFSFTEEQLMFQKSLGDLLSSKLSAKYLRDLDDSDTGRDQKLWQQFIDMGLLTICVPEDAGGLGLMPVDFVLLAEECGKHCLAEPLVNTSLVVAPMLAKLGDPAKDILEALLSGKSRVAIARIGETLVDDLHEAQWLIEPDDSGKNVHVLETKHLSYERQECLDTGRQVFLIQDRDSNTQRVFKDTADLWRSADNLGALGAAAQLLGLSQAMLDMSVSYCADRKQFGKPIGSFQAVKHMLANVAIELECARPVIYRAASALSSNSLNQVAVSHAKLSASRVSRLAARNCLQAHGAMGYTWEVDLHLWMKRAWSLDKAWGGCGFHKQRLAQYLDNTPNDKLGAGQNMHVDESHMSTHTT
jgi:alkylation response protein AidB-like acyl-CoA dehydrogenase